MPKPLDQIHADLLEESKFLAEKVAGTGAHGDNYYRCLTRVNGALIDLVAWMEKEREHPEMWSDPKLPHAKILYPPSRRASTGHYRDPEKWMLEDPLWLAIWAEIRDWDINVPSEYGGYMGATGNHATAIYLAIAGVVPLMDPEQVAIRFHDTYERLAPSFGYETREASRKPWSEVPDSNRDLMIALCAAIFGGKPTRVRGE